MKRDKLRHLRQQIGATQAEVAEMFGITTDFYGMIERGERNPSLDLAKKIAELLNSTVDELF